MRKDELWTLIFAAIVCVVCSLLLSSTSALLREKQEKNVEIDRKINVLRAFAVNTKDDKGRNISGDEVDQIFNEHIEEVVINRNTGEIIEGLQSHQLSKEDLKKAEKLPLYLWRDAGNVTKYAFPASGMGLWSTVYSYIALNENLTTIIGVTFFGHKETPGLGGECSADWFQDQFKGKKVWQQGKLLPFEVVKGSVASKYPDGCAHAVDGMSGATMTGNGITKFIRTALQDYESYFGKIRSGS